MSFPVLASIITPDSIAELLSTTHGFNNKPHCKILKTGINHTYSVFSNRGKYVYRVYSYNWRTREQIEEELKLLLSLRESGVSVSCPIPDSSGEFIQEIQAAEGHRYGVLFNHAEGEKVRALSVKDCLSLGDLMGKMHHATEGKEIGRVEYNAYTLTEQPYQYALEHFSESLEGMVLLKRAGEYVSDVFADADSNQLRKGIVHLDFWYDNMNIDEDSRITVFDFDFCGNGWLLLDVAYCVMQLFNTEPNKEMFEQKLMAFYNGYESVTAISDEEKRLLPAAGLAVWIFYLGVQSQRFDDWSNFFLSKNYLNHYLGMAQAWLNYNGVEV